MPNIISFGCAGMYELMFSCWEMRAEDRPSFKVLHDGLEKLYDEATGGSKAAAVICEHRYNYLHTLWGVSGYSDGLMHAHYGGFLDANRADEISSKRIGITLK